MPDDTPDEVTAIRAEIEKALNTVDASGRRVGDAKFGVYAFYDYDGEPIYVGQTTERLRVRIRRHLTNQRTDAVAMSVLDPFEVADIEMWPFFDLEGRKATDPDVRMLVQAAEYTVFQRVLEASSFGAVLNEKKIPPTAIVDLPPSWRFRIVPPTVFDLRKHSDIRIARRASTIAALARVISERQVRAGLRKTLLTQARRLERLARLRFEQVGGEAAVELAAPDDE